MASPRDRDERGQIIVIFALALVALVAMVGLILDGGSAFAQRRSEQNTVDLAALAAANDLIVNQGSANWVATARSVAKKNGFEHGVNGVTVDVTCKNCPGQAVDTSASGVQVTVGITAPHQNAFAGVVGMPTWDVSATATSKTGWPDTAIAPGPFIVSKKNFDTAGKATSCTDKDHQCDLKHPVDDKPPRRPVRLDELRLRQDVRGNRQRQRQRPPVLHGLVRHLLGHPRLRLLHRPAQQRRHEQHRGQDAGARPDDVPDRHRGRERQLRRLGVIRHDQRRPRTDETGSSPATSRATTTRTSSWTCTPRASAPRPSAAPTG